jgi:hypothetical protein
MSGHATEKQESDAGCRHGGEMQPGVSRQGWLLMEPGGTADESEDCCTHRRILPASRRRQLPCPTIS